MHTKDHTLSAAFVQSARQANPRAEEHQWYVHSNDRRKAISVSASNTAASILRVITCCYMMLLLLRSSVCLLSGVNWIASYIVCFSTYPQCTLLVCMWMDMVLARRYTSTRAVTGTQSWQIRRYLMVNISLSQTQQDRTDDVTFVVKQEWSVAGVQQ